MKDTGLLDGISAYEAYQKIHNEHYETVLRYLLNRVPEKERAEDMAQETFFVAWKSIDMLRLHPNIRAWLIKTAHNIRRNDIRKEIKRRLILAALKEASSKPSPRLNLFAGLSPCDIQILTLHYVNHLSTREIANVLEIKESATRQRLFRARNRLEKLLDEKNLLKKFLD